MSKAANAFLTVTTTHYADVSWWWDEKYLHDKDYHFKVDDSMTVKIKELERKYDVSDDTRYCTQFEGFQLFGEDKAKVEAAGRELAQHLARFKGIVSLNS